MPVKITGLDALLADLDRLRNQAGDMREAWPIIGRLWAQREERWIRSGGNGTWPMLRSATIVRKYSHAPLIDRGSLIVGLTHATPRNSGKAFAAYGPPKGDKSARYGALHAKGTARMPARKPVPRLTAAERRAFVAALRKVLMRGVS